MTYAFTDTVQIEEGFEIPTMLDNELSKVDLILWESYHIGGGAYTLEGENEWATELAVQGILEGKTPDEIAETIANEWEPSDAEMMGAFGTKWHDGL
jgi:hypothetical protein